MHINFFSIKKCIKNFFVFLLEVVFDFVTFKTRDITNSRNNATSFKHTVFYFFIVLVSYEKFKIPLRCTSKSLLMLAKWN